MESARVLTDTDPEFDAGPLTWVQGEIDEALARAGEALATFRANPADAAPVKHARAHAHQAAGAIQMVGLDGVVAFTDEVERHLVRLEELPAADVPATVDVVDRALNRLRVFLDEIGSGSPPVPLALAPEYEAMRKARGEANAAPADLFYPDLGVRPPRPSPAEIMPAARLSSHLLKARRQYQRGLLDWLRGVEGGAGAMREALAEIEAVTAQPNLRAFWWTAGALLEALERNALAPSFAVKQLVARVDMQIRRVTEGSAKVADRLRREVLYFIAVAAPLAPQIEAVQRAYRLAALVPAPETLDVDAVRIRPLVREAREQLASAKDAWLKAAAGRADSVPKLAQLLAATHAKAGEIGEPALARLTGALVERFAAMPPQGVSEPLAMEFATALLLAESAFENFNKLSPEFASQVDAMLARLAAATAGDAPADASAPALDEMSRRAQERLLLGQVMREVQANLRHMEQVLDAFFRDHTRRQELATLARDSQQIRGALRMLELDAADRLLALCQAQIDGYADPAASVDEDGLELLAESLSGLGFYVDAVIHQRPERERIIAPLIAKREGAPAPAAPVEAQSVEESVAELRATLPGLLADVRAAPSDVAARTELRARLVSLRDDADLIGDADLVAQVKAAIREIDDGAPDRLAARVDEIVEAGAAPAPAISEETQRLLATDASALDAELLDIYLTEADEVLDTVAAHRRALEHAPHDRDALVTVRRQFHTLKGSGRMVGLTELGELAWGVERVHNRLLEEDRRVTPAILALIGVAESSFRAWVRELRETGRFATDAAPLLAAIRAADAEMPGGAAAAPPPAPVVRSDLAQPSTAFADAANEAAATAEPDAAAPADRQQADAAAGEARDGPATARHEAHASHDEEAAGGDLAHRVPDLELVTFPELGAPLDDADAPTVTVIEESIGETIDVGVPADVRDAGKPLLRVVADNTSTLPHEARLRAATHTPDLTLLRDEARASAPPIDADEVSVGDARLSSSLWRILCDEADQHVALLQHEVSVLEFDPDRAPLASMIRASHTLCGIHRTGGIALVAAAARALEQALLALEESGAPFPGITQPVLARTVAGLAHFVGRVKACEGFTASDEREAAEIERELDELRQEALANVPPSEPLIPAEEGIDHLELVADVPEQATDEAPPAIAEAIAPPAQDAGAAGAADAAAPRPSPFLPDPGAAALLGFSPDVAARDEAAAPPLAASPDASVEEPAGIVQASVAEPMPEGRLEAAADAAAETSARAAPAAWEPPPPALVPAAAAPTDESLLDVVDDVDSTILPIFLEEAGELFPQAGELVRQWRREPGDGAAAAQLRRTLHTLKGSARMTGAMRLGELAHRAESRLSIGDQPVAPSDELFETLDTDLDRIGYLLDALREGAANAPLPWLAPMSAPAPAEAAPASAERSEGEAAAPPAARAEGETEPAATADGPRRRASDRAEAEPGRAMLRVRADIVDQLVNEAGEVAIARARVEGELRALKANLLELTSSVIRLRNQVREIELQAETQIQSRKASAHPAHEDFDPLELDRYTRFQELTRSLAEGVNDVSTVQQSLLKNLDDANAALLAQARLSRDVQQRLFAIRTVPFASLSERLYRVLRTTARELDKRANLEIQGGRTELDRSVLEKLVGPLEHLLRNALGHGIEARAARVAAGKSETGEITLTVRQVGNEITVELADDGAGIDFERVRERAVALGVLAQEAEPTIHELVECLFEPGFSTATEVTQISGRGIGMDVVRSEIVALGGRIDVHTTPGKGTRFNLFLPLTLAVAQTVIVRAAGRLWAVPAAMVEQVQQVKPDVLRSLYADARVQWQGRGWPFHYLPRLLGDTASVPDLARYNAVLLVRSGQGIAAIHVDEMIGNQEVVVKNIGAQLARVSGISGATVLGTGEIVLIINPVQLAQRSGVVRYDPADDGRLAEQASAPAPSTRPLVMVVDDSLTVRKFTTRLLAREGFEVVTARDGIDALKVLADHAPAAILLDIEMPRMDGFEFAKTIRGDPKTRGIPIVMITSRTADKHRSRAAELGVDRFLGKPYQEDELLGAIGELLGS